MRFIRNKNVCDLEDVRRYLREGRLDMYEGYGFGLYRVQQRESGTPAGMGICA